MKKFLSILLVVVLVISILAVPITANASVTEAAQTTYTSGDYEYELLSDGTAEITGYIGYNDEVSISSTLDGFKVTSIGGYAFHSCDSLTSITIPDSVTSIGDGAFSPCYSLTSITIPDSVTSIGDSAFSGCFSLTSITIPNSVTSIGDHAFSACDSLTSIKVDSNNKYYDSRDNCNAIIETSSNTLIAGCKNTVVPNGVTSIGDDAFEQCTSLKSITIPDSVTSIGDFAFSSCESLTSITIPDSVTSIGNYAFSSCESLTSITIPDSVTSIGNYAFAWCDNLSSISVDSNNTIFDSRENCNAIIETSTNTLIAGCKNTVIPNNVTGIGRGAFGCCSGLTSITIPDSVTSIGDCAFEHCYSLASITIPDSVTCMGDWAFNACSSLTSITISDSVTSIGDSAFEKCSSLTSITIPDSVTSIGYEAFYDCSSLTSITIPNSVTSIGNSAFEKCSSLTSITIPDSVTSIGSYAFYDCSGLISITIPDSVTSIGNYAFYDCSGLTSITIPDSVTSIGWSAFEKCSSLTSITIPDSVTWIDWGAFLSCDNLTMYVYEDSYAHEYAKEYDIPYEIIGNGNISFIDKGMRVYSDSNNLSVDKGKTIKIGVGVIDSGKESKDVSKVTFSIADTSVAKPLKSKIVDNVFFVEFEALKCGTTLVTFSDSLTGFTAEIPVNVYSASSSAFTLNSIGESFDGYQLTSIAKVCGLSMDNYSYSVDENTGEATLSFNVYNSSFTYGAVEVYSADGKLVNAAIIDKYSYNSTSMKSIFFDNFCYLIGDVYEGNLFSPTYYRSQIRSKKTSVSVIVPKGGYINITLDAYTSPVVNIANSIDLLLQTGELAGDLNGYKAQEKEFVSALTDKVVEDILVDAVDPAKTAKKLFKNIAKDTFMTKETLGNFVDTYSKNFYEVTHSFDLVTDLAKGFTFGTAEEILLSFTGGYKYLFEAFFTTGKITELMVQYQDMIDSKDSGTVTIQNQVGAKRTNSDITVECKTNFTDDTALKVFRVTPDSDLLNSIKESDPTGYSVIRNSLSYTYNISMIKNGEEIQPQDEVTVYIPIPEELKTFSVRGDVKIYRMEEDGTLTDMNAKVDGEYLVFNTTHFSLYSVVGVDSLGGIISDMLDYTFETSEDGIATLIKYNGTDAEIAIPSVYDGYVVTAIGAEAFKSSDITMVEMPDSVTDIADNVFENLDCTIRVYNGSYAHEYAVENGLKYILIEEDDTLIGDVDGDKRISIMDATYIQRHLAQLDTIPEDRLPCADTNKDTRVSILDATQIQLFIAKLIPSL